QRLARDEEPVLIEDALQIARSPPLDAHVDVAHLADPLHLAAVLVADVEAAGEGDGAVDDDDLPVVAEVHRLKEDRAHREERADLHPRLLERTEVARVDREAAVP